jgi:hypothetical protein
MKRRYSRARHPVTRCQARRRHLDRYTDPPSAGGTASHKGYAPRSTMAGLGVGVPTIWGLDGEVTG